MKLRQQKSLIFGMVFGSLLVASQSALASKPDSLGYSAVGLGHATTMNGPSWTLAATHPAGLLSCTEKTLSHGYTFSQFSKEVESQTTRTQTAQGFEGGLCLPSRLINLDTVIGLTWFLPNQHITSLRTQSPRGPMMVFFEDRLDRLAIVSSVALGERDVWGVGLGIEHLATTVGTIQLSGELLLDETEQPNLEGTIDFLFESKRRLLASAWVKLLPSLHWGIAYAAPLGLTVDLDLDFDGDVSSSPGTPLLEDVSLLLASHLYAYGTPPKWSSHLQLDHAMGELALEINLVDWAALEVPLPTSTVTTSLRDEETRVESTTNPMRSTWQVSVGYSSPRIISSETGIWRFHGGLRYDQGLTLPDQAIILDVPKLHVGFALEYRLQGNNAWPTVALGGRYVHGFSTIFTTENNDYGSFLTNLYGFSSQFDLTWSW